MGKTTTLWAVAYTVQADPKLSRQWLPVVFDEESRRVGDLADFWLEALRQWEHAAKDPADRAQQLLDKADANIEDAARIDFLEKVDRSGRRALLLIDNLNDLLSPPSMTPSHSTACALSLWTIPASWSSAPPPGTSTKSPTSTSRSTISSASSISARSRSRR